MVPDHAGHPNHFFTPHLNKILIPIAFMIAGICVVIANVQLSYNQRETVREVRSTIKEILENQSYADRVREKIETNLNEVIEDSRKIQEVARTQQFERLKEMIETNFARDRAHLIYLTKQRDAAVQVVMRKLGISEAEIDAAFKDGYPERAP